MLIASLLMWREIEAVASTVKHSRTAQATLESHRELYAATSAHLIALSNYDENGNLTNDISSSALVLKRTQDRVRSAIQKEVDVLVGYDDEEAEEERGELVNLDKMIALTNQRIAEAKSLAKEYAQNPKGRDHTKAQIGLRNGLGSELGDMFSANMANEERETNEAIEESLEELENLVILGGIFLIGILVVLFISGYLLQQMVLKPVQTLHVAVHNAAVGGKFSSVGVSNLVEFAALQFEFRLMLDEVKAHREHFMRDKAELESLVSVRTDELRKLNEKLMAADSARTRFLSDISHELRTPLTLIRGEAEIGLRGVKADIDSLRAALRRVKEISDQMATLVDDLLFMSRFQDAGLRLDMGEYNLTQLLQQAASDSITPAQRRGVELQLVPPTEVLVAACDRTRIRQVLLILLDNATRYAERNGVVEVSLRGEGRTAIFQVSNDGPGINAADLPHVFERYFRGESARQRDQSGIGIGLSIAKVIVEAHQGSITADSIPGERTTFTVKIPITGIMNANTRH